MLLPLEPIDILNLEQFSAHYRYSSHLVMFQVHHHHLNAMIMEYFKHQNFFWDLILGFSLFKRIILLFICIIFVLASLEKVPMLCIQHRQISIDQ